MIILPRFNSQDDNDARREKRKKKYQSLLAGIQEEGLKFLVKACHLFAKRMIMELLAIWKSLLLQVCLKRLLIF